MFCFEESHELLCKFDIITTFMKLDIYCLPSPKIKFFCQIRCTLPRKEKNAGVTLSTTLPNFQIFFIHYYQFLPSNSCFRSPGVKMVLLDNYSIILWKISDFYRIKNLLGSVPCVCWSWDRSVVAWVTKSLIHILMGTEIFSKNFDVF